MTRSLSLAVLSVTAVAAQSSIDLFVPGDLPNLDGPGSIVSEGPEVTAVALGCDDSGACPVTVHQGAETWSYSQDGTVIACRLDIPEDTANCEWDTPQTSITGDLPSIGALFVPIEITAGGGEGGGDTTATSTTAPPPAPTSTSVVVPTVTDTSAAGSTSSSSSSEDEDCTDVTSVPAPTSLPSTPSSSLVTSSTFGNTTIVPTSSGGSGGDDSTDTPAPTTSGGEGGEQPTDTPAAAPKAVLNGLLAGAAIFVAGALAL
jgi:hypothetical protein